MTSSKTGHCPRPDNGYLPFYIVDSADERDALIGLLDDMRHPLGRDFVVEGMMGLVGFVQKAAIQRPMCVR